MNIKQAKKLIKVLFHLQISTGIRYAVEILSGPGLGKSEMIKQIAAELEVEMKGPVGVKAFFLSTQEAPDMAGYAMKGEDEDGTPRLVRTKPEWYIRPNDPKYGILFLDEFRQGSHDVIKPTAELKLNGQVGEWKLPITWMSIAASNREKDRSGVSRELAFVTNRRIEINLTPDVKVWTEWAEKAGVHWMAIAWANAQPGLVFKDEVPDKPGPFCTPRSLVKLATLIEPLKDEMALFTETAAGLIGEGAAAQFVAFMRVIDQLPTFAEIEADPMKAKLPDPQRPDAQYATMQMVSHHVQPKSAMAAFKYLGRLPKEFQIAGLRSTLARCPQVVQQPEFATWLRDNKDLIVSANLLGATQ